VTVSVPPNRVRLIRQALGMSQAELARRVGISASLLSRAERGEIRPWPRLRRAAAAAVGVSEVLLFGDDQ